MYRELTAREKQRALYYEQIHTEAETRAYKLLPKSMKEKVQSNPVVVFAGNSSLFFPDLFFARERICVEIDGGAHDRKKERDARRDKIFKDNGITVIRIKNKDTHVNVAFWQRLAEGLETYSGDEVTTVEQFKAELREMIAEEVSNWTNLETVNLANTTELYSSISIDRWNSI